MSLLKGRERGSTTLELPALPGLCRAQSYGEKVWAVGAGLGSGSRFARPLDPTRYSLNKLNDSPLPSLRLGVSPPLRLARALFASMSYHSIEQFPSEPLWGRAKGGSRGRAKRDRDPNPAPTAPAPFARPWTQSQTQPSLHKFELGISPT